MNLISCQFFFSIEPIHRVKELLDGMKTFPPSEWRQLGWELGFEEHELNTIKSNEVQVGGVEGCKTVMLIKWFNSSGSEITTWARIYDVLLKLNKSRLAEQIAADYGKFTLHVSVTTGVTKCCAYVTR